MTTPLVTRLRRLAGAETSSRSAAVSGNATRLETREPPRSASAAPLEDRVPDRVGDDACRESAQGRERPFLGEL